MKFHYKNALKTHLVREHNQEREFECSVCRTQFMHKKNYTRIMDLLTAVNILHRLSATQYNDP